MRNEIRTVRVLRTGFTYGFYVRVLRTGFTYGFYVRVLRTGFTCTGFTYGFYVRVLRTGFTYGFYVWVLRAARITDLDVVVAGPNNRPLSQARESAADGTAALVVDDLINAAEAWREAVDQREVESSAAKRHRAAALHDGPIIAAGATGSGNRAADLLVKIRSGIECEARDREGGWVARREGAAGLDRRGAGGAAAADTGAAFYDYRRRRDRAVDLQGARFHGGRSGVGVDRREIDRAGAVDHDAAAALAIARCAAVVGGGGGALVVANHADNRLEADRTEGQRVVALKVDAVGERLAGLPVKAAATAEADADAAPGDFAGTDRCSTGDGQRGASLHEDIAARPKAAPPAAVAGNAGVAAAEAADAAAAGARR